MFKIILKLENIRLSIQLNKLSGFVLLCLAFLSSGLVAFQALHEAITKHGRNIKNSEHFPSSRKIVDDEHWFNAFKLRRSNDDAKPDAIRKSFNRARGKLQEYDYIREYENKIWCIDEPDRQDK